MEPGIFSFCQQHSEFVSLAGLPHIHLDLRYASPNNILKRDLYGGTTEAWLHRDAWQSLVAASEALQLLRPGWKLRIYDAARPLSVQAELYAKVQGTSQQAYVADPAHGSPHNYGMAVDLGLQDDQGWEADHGTAFDSFEDKAQPQLEEAIYQQGRLSAEHLGLRRLLRELMQQQGFIANPLEWWHFDRLPLARVKQSYALIPGFALNSR